MKENYYLGLDIGTSSVGYAVTDKQYHVLKFRGRAMWGSRLFEEGVTAEERRTARTTRRRLERRRWRIELLQDLFAEEISAVDPGFYQRLKDSQLWDDSKKENPKYCLFNDNGYTDREFHKEYKTIYHLRKALVTEDKKFDIRLIYLALHHLVKHRGHFLFSGSVEKATSFDTAYETLVQCLQDELGIGLECRSKEELESVLKDKTKKPSKKEKEMKELLGWEKKDKQLEAVIKLICGLKGKISSIFDDDSLVEMEKNEINFAKDSYDEIRAILEAQLQERCNVIDVIKALYDWAILADILKGGKYGDESYLCVAKATSYEKHAEDLKVLKEVIREADREEYIKFFKDEKGKDNYCAYVGFTKKDGKKIKVKTCKHEDITKRIKKILDQHYKDSEDSRVVYIRQELEQNTFLPKQVVIENSLIPYQVRKIEVKKILENAKKYYPFLSEVDEDGISVEEKVIKTFEFRVPYYVGPLNTNKNEHAWAVRKPEAQDGKITPWNIEKKIDFDQSGEKFIRRMTNKCTYLIGRDVLPKNSLLYGEFMVWNEINNIKVGSDCLPVEVKKKLFEDVFQMKKRVRRKDIENFLTAEGIDLKENLLTGLDINVKSSLTAYHDFRKIFGEDVKKYSVQQMIEDIIGWITVYGQESKMVKNVIRKKYGKEQITEEQLKKIIRLKYDGWGRFSREFLCELEGANKETGEIYTIIGALRETNDNLMQLLSQRYTFWDEVTSRNQEQKKTIDKITYETVLGDRMASPAVKKSIWQAVLIVEEIKKIMGKEPEKIFIEMTRAGGKKERTTSRKEQLLQLYKHIKDEERDWAGEIDGKTEEDFRSIKTYLYYTQMGRCMYTGEKINYSQLNDAQIYDKDHIYPRSKTKDDSLDNLVLVKREVNGKKKDEMISPEIREKMSEFWKALKQMKLISEEKYRRLTRKEPLTKEELAGFINRQLVETSQASKLTAEVAKEICPSSKIVYVKAGRVSELRKDPLNMIKVRSLNDYHHAKDAYLNIVAGNVYYEKFTNNPLKWLKESPNATYSLNQMYRFDIEKNGELIWKGGENGSIQTVRKQMRKNNIQYTRQAYTNKRGQNGGFFDQNPVSKDASPAVPLKKGLDTEKYGGHKNLTYAYLALVESENRKGEKIRTLEGVPLYLKDQLEQGKMSFEAYCEEQRNLKNPRVLLKKIKKSSYFVVNKFPMHLQGSGGVDGRATFQGAVQLCLPEEQEKYLKKIEKYIARNQKEKGNGLLALNKWDGISKEQNEQLYQTLQQKLTDTIYQYRPKNQIDTIEKGYEKFLELSCEEQCIVLNEILWLFRCTAKTRVNLKKIGGKENAGVIRIKHIISNEESVILYHQSVTGLYEQKIDLLGEL